MVPQALLPFRLAETGKERASYSPASYSPVSYSSDSYASGQRSLLAGVHSVGAVETMDSAALAGSGAGDNAVGLRSLDAFDLGCLISYYLDLGINGAGSAADCVAQADPSVTDTLPDKSAAARASFAFAAAKGSYTAGYEGGGQDYKVPVPNAGLGKVPPTGLCCCVLICSTCNACLAV